MATLIDTPPDKIEQRPNGQYLFYFTGGKDLLSLRMKAEYTVVSLTTMHATRGRVVRYRIIMRPGASRTVEVVDERALTPEEIGYFEWLIAGQ